MIVLAVDTCLDACSAAVVSDGAPLAVRIEPMTRGHQERLAPMAREVMAEAGLAFARLDRIAATLGPGSFTGLRVGLSFAKGLAQALDIPLAGVGTLQALAGARPGLVCAAIDARRGGQVYLQAFRDGRPVMAPDSLPTEIAAARLAELGADAATLLVGSGAPMLAPLLPAARVEPAAHADPVAVARIGAAMVAPLPPARPLYLRAPDAKLPGGLDPSSLDPVA